VIPLDLLPRRCPVCHDNTIIGHGRRFRQAHDDRREHIWVRRGICHPCNKTFTILPDWLAPAAPFSLQCRQQACESIGAGDPVEQAAPHCKDPPRLPDPSTLRRWAHRRLISVCSWLKAGAMAAYFFRPPAIVAWDLAALCRIPAPRGKKSVNREALDDLKEQIPLMGYLHAQDWRPARPLSRGRWMGLCPLHGDHNPSFLVDNNKGLFYCYGCGRGGDVIRFAELYRQVKFPQAVELLRQWRAAGPVLQEAVRFYRTQFHRHSEAFVYLYERGIRSAAPIEEMRIGYAPGGCLRGWLTQLGHSLPALCQTGLVTEAGYDAYVRRIVFPLEGNLYGRSLSDSAPVHRFLPGAKGGLYLWERVQSYPEVILVEGLFDYAAVWQAGFQNVTCSLGAHLNTRQFRQLCDAPRTVYLAFDADTNGSGQQAAQSLAGRLPGQGVNARRASLPEGHDPNSFFAQGGDARQFQSLLEAAQ
jgi:5S rRNA maturation endonuclease (ribonuclease M5)